MSFYDKHLPYLNKKLVEKDRVFREQAVIQAVERDAFMNSEQALRPQMIEKAQQMGWAVNIAAELPDDAWRDIDEVTKRVMRNDEGMAYMEDLMPMARTVNIGKTVHQYRVSTDTGVVQRSMAGQVPDEMDKVNYSFRGHPVPIFTTGYGRNWREWLGQQSEGFDAMVDDHEAHMAALKQDMAQYVLNGDTGIITQGFQGYGIKNHPFTQKVNLGAGGTNPLNIDLSDDATTSDTIERHFTRDIARVWDDNFINMPVMYYVSPAIMRRLETSYTGQAGFKGGTLREFLTGKDRIMGFKRTYELEGNEYFGFVPNSQYIRLLIGMAASTIAIPRTMMTDDYNFRIMAALGLEIRADANNRSGVLYAADMS